MPTYEVTTLIDITRTNANRDEKDPLKIKQQANFNSLIQSIGLRSNLDWNSDPKIHTGALPTDDGKANHWIWKFNVERESIFEKGKDPVGLLIDDLDGVPVISGLLESIDLDPSVFRTKGKNINTWIKII